jgi:hypothetical protein
MLYLVGHVVSRYIPHLASKVASSFQSKDEQEFKEFKKSIKLVFRDYIET